MQRTGWSAGSAPLTTPTPGKGTLSLSNPGPIWNGPVFPVGSDRQRRPSGWEDGPRGNKGSLHAFHRGLNVGNLLPFVTSHERHAGLDSLASRSSPPTT